jgi:peptide subunit release factor 1 (eRF1)
MGVIVSRSSSKGTRGGTSVAARPPRRPNAPPVITPFAGQLARLTAVTPGQHRVVSCYLKLEPRDRSRGKYLIKLKNRVRAALDALPRLGLSRAVEDAARRDIGRVIDHLRIADNLPATQGVAVFACEALGLFETVALPVVYRSRLAVDATPLVKELASLEDEFGRILTVVLDRTGARFFEVTAFEARELPGLHSPSTRGSRFRGDEDGPGWGEHNYNNRIREEKQRHFEAVARQLFALDRGQPAHGIVLGASGPDVRTVEPFLHSYLAERLMGTFKLTPRQATPALAHAATLEVREEWERATEKHLVAEVTEAFGSGWALNGVRETLRALARGQVRSLLVHSDVSMPGFRCSESGRLAVLERDCRGEGEPVPVLDVLDEAIEDALRQHVDVNVVYDPESREQIDGLAALLRFR